MYDINLTCQPFKAARDDVIVELAGADSSENLVGDAQLAAGQSGHDFRQTGHWPVQHTGERKHMSTCLHNSTDLLPGGVTNARGTEFVRKRVEDPDLFPWSH